MAVMRIVRSSSRSLTLFTVARARTQLVAFVVFFALVVLYPLVLAGRFERGMGTTIGMLAVGTVGFVLLVGYAQQLALGQGGFYMIGGYGTAVLTAKYGWDPLLAMVVSMLLAMSLAYLVGRPTLRLRGFNLAMASLAFHFIVIVLASQFKELTGGAAGIPGVPVFSVLGWKAADDLSFYYVVWFFVALAIIIGLNIDRSRIGRALRSIAASEAAASSVGIDVTKYKVQMFVLSAGMASVAGSLFAHYLRLMEPSVFSFEFSMGLITAVVIGGLASIWGGAVGAVAIVGLREGIRILSLPLYEPVIMGALIVLVLMIFPRGLAGGIGTVYFWVLRRLEPGPREEDEAPHAQAEADLQTPFRSAVEMAPLVSGLRDDAPLLVVEHVCKRFGRLAAVEDVSFSVQPHSITALIGPNGAGKSTLFSLISGHLPVDAGHISFAGRRIQHLPPDRIGALGIGRTFQNLQLFSNMTVLENVMAGRHRKSSSGIVDVSLHLPNVGREECQIRGDAERYLSFVGLSQAAHLSPAVLPFGHQRMVEVARALALEPTLLIMDEPASGLNDVETERLAELILRIHALGTTVLLVEHDMRVVMGLADYVVVLNYGQKIAEGSPDQVRANPEVVSAYLGSSRDE